MEFLLSILRCPYCGGKLLTKSIDKDVDDKIYGILKCSCDEYPIIAGIPIIRKGQVGGSKYQHKKIISLVQAKDYRNALLYMLFNVPIKNTSKITWNLPLSLVKKISNSIFHFDQSVTQAWINKAEKLIFDNSNVVTACDLFDIYFNRSNKTRSNAYNYFAYRFGQPRHLVALSLAQTIEKPSKPVLDLGCGFGHIARDLIPRSNGQPVIGVDNNYFTLYVAKYWVAPEAEYVFCDGDLTLPFNDDTFSDLMCINSFHTFQNKVSCVNEAKRVTSNNGVIVLAGLRHTRYGAITPNPLLLLEEYQALLGNMRNRLIADSDVLDRYLRKEGPCLQYERSIDELNKEPFVTLVASNRDEVFRDFEGFDSWPHGNGKLAFNPLYHAEEHSDKNSITMRRQFPSEEYEEENKECNRYLPEKVEVSIDVFNNINIEKNSQEVESLVKQCVLLGMPERYC